MDDLSDLYGSSSSSSSSQSSSFSSASLDDFSDVVPGGINKNSSSLDDTDQYGMPLNNPISSNPTNLVQSSPDNSSNGSFIDSLEGYAGNAVSSVKSGANSLLNGVESLGSSALHGAESAVKGAYGAVKTVAGDVTGGVEGVASGIFNHMILWVVVVGGLIYLIASTNNFKVNASVPLV